MSTICYAKDLKLFVQIRFLFCIFYLLHGCFNDPMTGHGSPSNALNVNAALSAKLFK